MVADSTLLVADSALFSCRLIVADSALLVADSDRDLIITIITIIIIIIILFVRLFFMIIILIITLSFRTSGANSSSRYE